MNEKDKIQAEYNALCAESGHLSFQLHYVIGERLDAIAERLKELNKLAAALDKAPAAEQGKGE